MAGPLIADRPEAVVPDQLKEIGSKLELGQELLVPTTLVFGSERKGLFQLIGEGEMKHGPVVTLPIQVRCK